MFHGFRQNMAWLHTWTGLLAGWVLYFVFLTGTFGYVNVEVDHWMRPEEPMVASPPPASDLVAKAERRLIGQAADAGHWSIGLPGGRQGHRLTVAWVERPAGDGAPPARMAETLDLHSGLPVTYASRDTGGGFTLYWMHFFLHYVPRDVGIRIVGICSMFMLVAILTGVVAHRRIFRDFFTFRPGKGQRSWLDAHNLLGVTSLPFHVMITWSGLIFYLFAYMPAGFDILYPEGEARARLAVYSYGIERPPLPAREHAEPGPPAPLASLPAILSEAEKRWGSGAVARIEVDHPHRGNARITVTSQPISTVGRRDAPQLSFDGTTGRSLNEKPPHRSAPDRFHSVMLGLHEAHFAGPFLRALFIGAGLAGTAMIATGLLLWSAKRRAKGAAGSGGHAGVALVDRLNVGTIVGLPIGIAAYFWANRLLPVGMASRGAWEMHCLFLAWEITFMLAIWLPPARVWRTLCWTAAGAFGLLPVLNLLTTDRHLAASIPAGDWILAGFDLSALGAGTAFAFLAHGLRTKFRERAGIRSGPAEAAR